MGNPKIPIISDHRIIEMWEFHCRLMDSKNRKAVVYYLGDGEGHIKIGTSENLVVRVHQIRKKHSDKTLHLLATEPGGARVETFMHARFLESRYRNEWFWADEPLVAYIDQLTRKVMTKNDTRQNG